MPSNPTTPRDAYAVFMALINVPWIRRSVVTETNR
jgi:hypothetical protein